jgi:hypothetical protein
MDNSDYLRTNLGSKSTPMILVTVTLLLCAVIISAAAGVAPSFVIAQQEEEDTSLGEEDLTTPRIITVPQDITE